MLLLRKKRWIGTPAFGGLSELNLEEGWVALDTEATGLDPYGKVGVDRKVEPAAPFMFQFCDPDGNTAWARLPVEAETRKIVLDKEVLDAISTLCCSHQIAKVFYNRPYDDRMLRRVGVKCSGEMIDSSLALHVCMPHLGDYGLKSVSKRLLGIDDEDEKELDKAAQSFRLQIGFARKRILNKKERPGDRELSRIQYNNSGEDEAYKSDFWLAPHDICLRYGLQDAVRTATLWTSLMQQMDEDMAKGFDGSKLWETFRQEQELQKTIMSMETTGIAVDRLKVHELKTFYKDIMETAEEAVKIEAGEDFNPRSNVQMQQEFYSVRKFKPLKYIKNKGKKEPNPHPKCKGKGCEICQQTGHNPKCDGDFLASVGVKRELAQGGEESLVMRDPLAYHLLRMKAAKAMGDFVKTYDECMVYENNHWVLHPNYWQCEAYTLRMSCSKPNLQNVADDDSGKKKIDVPYRPRECFIPRNGCVIYAPDYSQIEVWLLMLRSRDKALREALLAGGDLHGNIASKLWPKDFDLSLAMVDKKKAIAELAPDRLANLKRYVNRRKRSKNIQFCKIYGGGAARIAELIGDGCTVDEAKQFIAAWEMLFPDVAGWMDEKMHIAKQYGYSENAYGYKYPVDRNLAYRAVNYDIQGSAAFLIKRANIRLGTRTELCPYIRPLLQVHDELLIEVKKDYNNMETMRAIVDDMQGDWKLLGNSVPFPVGMKVIETTWADAVEVKL